MDGWMDALISFPLVLPLLVAVQYCTKYTGTCAAIVVVVSGLAGWNTPWDVGRSIAAEKQPRAA